VAHPNASFALGWDSVLPKAAAVATKRGPISCTSQEDQNPRRFEGGDSTLTKKRKGGPAADEEELQAYQTDSGKVWGSNVTSKRTDFNSHPNRLHSPRQRYAP
jgi:hypothetical protein